MLFKVFAECRCAIKCGLVRKNRLCLHLLLRREEYIGFNSSDSPAHYGPLKGPILPPLFTFLLHFMNSLIETNGSTQAVGPNSAQQGRGRGFECVAVLATVMTLLHREHDDGASQAMALTC